MVGDQQNNIIINNNIRQVVFMKDEDKDNDLDKTKNVDKSNVALNRIRSNKEVATKPSNKSEMTTAS